MWEPDVIRLFEDPKGRTLSVMGSTGFIGSRYCAMYPEQAYPEPSRMVQPLCKNVLYLRSTVDNYGPMRGDLRTDIEVNLLHLATVLDHVGHMRARGTFTFVSSWFVWGTGAGSQPWCPAHETDPCDPNGWYAITKLAAEKLVRSYCQTFDIPYRILRLSNVIGNDPRAGKQKAALVHMLGKVVRSEEIEVYEGDGYRDVLYVEDTCRAIRLVTEKGSPNTVYNVGRGESHRMVDLIEYAIKRVGSRSVIKRVPVPAFHRIVQTESFHLDTNRLQRLGFTPQMTIWESVDRVLEDAITHVEDNRHAIRTAIHP